MKIIRLVSNRVLYDSANSSLGKQDKNHTDWLDPNDQILHDLMDKGDQAHQRVLYTRITRYAVEAYTDACIILQKYTRTRKSEWWEIKAEEPQRDADRNDMKGFYFGLSVGYTVETTCTYEIIFTYCKCVM